MKIRLPVLIGVGVAALLTQCLALHALTEEDIATLDALTENDFTVPNFTGVPQW